MEVYIAEHKFSTFFAPLTLTLTLTRWLSNTNKFI